jgi:hypothetical protein
MRRTTGGEAGIRTLGTGLSPYNGLANRRLQPLGHLTLRLAPLLRVVARSGAGPRLASLAQGEPQTLSVREIRTCLIQVFSFGPMTVFQTAAFAESGREIRISRAITLGTLAEKHPEFWSH